MVRSEPAKYVQDESTAAAADSVVIEYEMKANKEEDAKQMKADSKVVAVKPDDADKEIDPDDEELLTPNFAMFILERYLVLKCYYGLPGTDGGYLSNYIEHMKQEHSILSIFYTNIISPFDREERALFFFTNTSFLLLFTLLLKETYYVVPIMAVIKKVFRYNLECSFFYTRAYDRRRIANKFSKRAGRFGCVLGLGSCISAMIMLINIILLIVVFNNHQTVTKSQQTVTENFLKVWFESFLWSVFFTEFVTEIGFMYMYFDGHKKNFHDRFDKHFAEDNGPKSMTDVALRAEQNYYNDPIRFGDVDVCDEQFAKLSLKMKTEARGLFLGRWPLWRTWFMYSTRMNVGAEPIPLKSPDHPDYVKQGPIRESEAGIHIEEGMARGPPPPVMNVMHAQPPAIPTVVGALPPLAPQLPADSEWKSQYDALQQKYYYYNTKTSEVSWTAPVPATADVIPSAAVSAPPAAGGALPPLAPQLPAGSDWNAQYDEGQQKYYYYNTKTSEVSWTAPVAAGAAAPTPAAIPAPPSPSGGPPQLPAGSDWNAQYDEGQQKYYYYNTKTSEVSWTAPVAAGAAAPTPQVNLLKSYQTQAGTGPAPPPLPEGQGQMEHSNIIQSSTGDKDAQGLPHGRNVSVTYTDGGVYEGQMSSGIRQGSGKMVYHDEHTYEGNWKNDMRDGKGKYMNYQKQIIFAGSWSKDKMGKRDMSRHFFF